MEELTEWYAWLFVHKEWNKLRRQPTLDKGFEEEFRNYLYRQIKPDVMSNIRDIGFGLSYSTASGVPHELDVIYTKERNKFVFELKHYETSDITKEIIFTFLGKIIDFYLNNVETLQFCKITMFLVTINNSVDDSIRKLCIVFGIKLIEPSLMTFGTMEYLARDLYQKLSDDDPLKSEVEKLIEDISKFRQQYDYSFSEFFRYSDGKIEIGPLPIINASEILNKNREYSSSFEKVKQAWKSKRN